MATAEGTATRRVESFDIASKEVPLPDGISGENGLVRAIFDAYDGAEALALVTGDKIIYLLPWAARSGCIAGYEQDLETIGRDRSRSLPSPFENILRSCARERSPWRPH